VSATATRRRAAADDIQSRATDNDHLLRSDHHSVHRDTRSRDKRNVREFIECGDSFIDIGP